MVEGPDLDSGESGEAMGYGVTYNAKINDMQRKKCQVNNKKCQINNIQSEIGSKLGVHSENCIFQMKGPPFHASLPRRRRRRVGRRGVGARKGGERQKQILMLM